MTDPTIPAWSRENDLLFQLRQLREENERMAKRIKYLEVMTKFTPQSSNIKLAQNTRGFLIRTLNSLVFRVYNSDHTFTDYDILHHDLEVTINSADAMFYKDNSTLDYQYI
jgi:hypothetical protein